MKSLERKIMGAEPTLVVFQHADNQDTENVEKLLASLKAQYGDKVNIEHVDATHDGNIKVSYKLHEYPTWIIYRQGEELMRVSGHKSEAELVDMIKRAM
ncbi:MAG: thioredoxin family protein [Muribaculaceae bacterium]|nr:thioredoxin family protein [Muribaculaceae bacterium]